MAYIINIDVYQSIGTHWIVSYVNGNNIIYFDSFDVEHIPKIFFKTIEKQKYNNKLLRNQWNKQYKSK